MFTFKDQEEYLLNALQSLNKEFSTFLLQTAYDSYRWGRGGVVRR